MPTYGIVNVDAALAPEIEKIKRKLFLMGINDIPYTGKIYIEVNYRYAHPAQKKMLDKIIEIKKRYDAWQTLKNNGGTDMTSAEQKIFNVRQTMISNIVQKTK